MARPGRPPPPRTRGPLRPPRAWSARRRPHAAPASGQAATGQAPSVRPRTGRALRPGRLRSATPAGRRHRVRELSAGRRRRSPRSVGGSPALPSWWSSWCVAVIAIRAVIGGTVEVGGRPGGGPASQDACPAEQTETPIPTRIPTTVGCTAARSPTRRWARPGARREPDNRVPFGSDVLSQIVPVESELRRPGRSLGGLGPGRRTAGRGRLLHPGAGLADRGQVHPGQVLRQQPGQQRRQGQRSQRPSTATRRGSSSPSSPSTSRV